MSTILEMLPCISAGELEGRVGSYELRTPRFIFLDGSIDGDDLVPFGNSVDCFYILH